MTAFIGIIGGVISAIGAMQSANASARAAEYNAAVAERNRKVVLDQADNAAQDKILENKRRLSSVRAAYGAAGIDLAGSPLEVLYDSALEGALDVKKIRYSGELQAIEQTDKSNLAHMEAKNYRTAGAISAIGAIFGGVGRSLQAA